VLPALSTRITLDEIYEGVALPPLAVGEEETDWGDYAEDDEP
jgi:hypothetical protein